MAKKFVSILEDIEKALSREVRRISFFENRNRSKVTGTKFKEMFNTFTGELVQKPIDPNFYDDESEPSATTSPRFTIRLLKIYEDLETKRLLPSIGEEFVECLPSAKAYEVRFAGDDGLTTDGGSDSIISLNNRKIRSVQAGDLLRILSGNNQGTYRISQINLLGNGPHDIVLDNDLIIDMPVLTYNKDAGIVTFSEFVDLSAIKAGDQFEDVTGAIFTITAVDVETPSFAVAAGSAVATGIGGKITRIGDVLQNDDSGETQCYTILNPNAPVAGKATKYRKRSSLIPYTFLYYVKISSRERDDHIGIAQRMMEVFNPPRGSLCVVTKSQLSAESELTQNAKIGDTLLYLKDASCLYAGETIQLCDNLQLGEELTIDSVNLQSNAITLKTPISKQYTINQCALVISNADVCIFERDFMNHDAVDKVDEQLWIHRFTYKIEAWIESRIDYCADDTEEQTFRDVGDVKFVQTVLEDMEGNELCEDTLP